MKEKNNSSFWMRTAEWLTEAAGCKRSLFNTSRHSGESILWRKSRENLLNLNACWGFIFVKDNDNSKWLNTVSKVSNPVYRNVLWLDIMTVVIAYLQWKHISADSRTSAYWNTFVGNPDTQSSLLPLHWEMALCRQCCIFMQLSL